MKTYFLIQAVQASSKKQAYKKIENDEVLNVHLDHPLTNGLMTIGQIKKSVSKGK